MGNEKLTAEQRREIVLSALAGSSMAELARRYGVARSWVYTLLKEATTNPDGKLEEARKELEFRQELHLRVGKSDTPIHPTS